VDSGIGACDARTGEREDDFAALRARLEDARRELLDLTPRNRLLDTPRRRRRCSSLEILDERSAQVFSHLVAEGKAMSFLPRPDRESPGGGETAQDEVLFDAALEQPEEAGTREEGLAARHTDSHLQTGLSSAALQQRLLRLHHDARTYQEEQGVNILYLALGFLRWYESENSQVERHAPLILVPVELDRPSAASRFRIRWTGEDIATNLSLQAKLKGDFGVELPDLPGAEDLSPGEYFEQVRRAVSTLPRWDVLPDDVVLWFFSFAKLLMYRDLDPGNWPQGGESALESRRLLRALLLEGFRTEPPLCGDDEKLDDRLPPLQTVHILDADSSQSQVIEEVRRGRDLIVQGPPGTGKSQTIANIIAAAVCEGKRVLFLAEKMAALDVVRRRLINAGLGDPVKDQCDLCLELHSTRATRRMVVEELARTLLLQPPVTDGVHENAARLQEARDRLNAHCALMHAPVEPAGLSPFQVVGELVRLRAAGIGPAEFALHGCESWTPQDRQSREALLGELAAFVREIGLPADHPWRGVELEVVLPGDRQRLAGRLPPLVERLESLARGASELGAMLHSRAAGTLAAIRRLIDFAALVGRAPDPDDGALADAVWDAEPAGIARLLEDGRRLEECRSQLAGVVVDSAWSADVDAVRRDLAVQGPSMLRLLRRSYRRAVGALRGMTAGRPPRKLAARLHLLDALIAGRAARQAVSAAEAIGRRAFGRHWHGEHSDWAALAAIDRWRTECLAHPAAPEESPVLPPARARADAASLAERLAGELDLLVAGLADLFDALKLDSLRAFGGRPPEGASVVDEVAPGEIADRLRRWQSDPESLTQWIAYRLRDRQCRGRGLGEICDRLYDGRLPPEAAAGSFRMACHEALLHRLMEQHPELARFDGLAHERILEDFRRLDLERIRLARQQAARAHYERIPRGGSDIGELGIIRREIHKRRRHLPIRQLLKQAGQAVTRIKPVFMMSPLSLAQYVEPGGLEFDLLLIDEASQVRPVDALGAAARSKQIVVVGDDKQLPPTRFFARTLDDLDAEDWEADERAGDLESILGLCHAQNMPDRMLRWHYRSRHHSLIAVSNREFYDNRLQVIPSPWDGEGELGVVFRHVACGVYDRGASATNRVEAEAVARAVMEHAERSPHLTLGVGAFSIRQRDAILDELERQRRRRPDLERFFAPATTEPFFVKNLENIQGDERDVIFISVGFGRDGSGYMSMHFGPVSVSGGERRLNVLISRARRRCEVFSSITHDDIDLSRATGRGPQVFKAFLRFARTGSLDVGVPSGAGHQSPFEEAVAGSIEAAGYPVDAQVGIAGFFVDLAVRDPGRPGRYLVAIECDGAAYHSSRSARDRDRLRQQVLVDRGWSVHRIWSTDWFNRPEQELRRVISAIEGAMAGGSGPCGTEALRAAKALPPALERGQADPGRRDDGASFVVPYVEASFRVPRSIEIHELPVDRLAEVVRRIVEIEGPIHGDEVAKRVTSLWGLSRTGSRISAAVARALESACRRHELFREGDFYAPTSGPEVTVRNRGGVESKTLRRPEMLPPAEIRRCVVLLVERHLGVRRDEAIVTTARHLGFQSTSVRLQGVIGDQIDGLVADGVLLQINGGLYPPGAAAT
jgi:very-short-patch-repair endonuclease